MSEVSPFAVDDLYDRAPCGLLTTTSDDVILTANSTFLQWTGFTADDIIGQDFHQLLETGSQTFYATRYQAELWSREQMSEVALTVLRADGTALPVLLNSQLVSSPADGTSIVQLAVFDSTARKDYEREMLAAKRSAEVSEFSVRIIQEALTRFHAATTEAELGEALVLSASEAFATSDAAVVLFHNDGTFDFAAGNHLRSSLIDFDDALLGTIRPSISEMTILNLDDAYADSPRAGDVLRTIRTEALTAVAIVDGNTVLGSLVCIFGRVREFDQSAIALHHALARQAGVVLSRLRLQGALREMAMHDQLTGLANRNLIDDRLAHAMAASTESGTAIALIFVDLDGFKKINDDLGHRVGDMVLQTVSARMRRSVRDPDIVGRFGGDEFVVICEGADENTARMIAERLISVIREPIPHTPDGTHLSASVGVVVHLDTDAPITTDLLIRRADEAMYESKRAGADRVTIAR
ncbi:MAG: hypothetical protein JWQ43_21 [Glaciihabitans sp.]|nr:hypothetical protein [Glaciihabitans sp.]